MKLLDRYILRSLTSPFGYCLTGFMILIVIHDLFDHLDNFIDAKTPLPDILRYYGLLLPSVLVIIIPVALMLGVLYSLLQLTKNNELTAMRASGVSLYRLISPFITTGVVLALAMACIHETVGPQCGYMASQFLRYQKYEESAHIQKEIAYYNTRERRNWFMGTFHTETFDMTGVRVAQEHDDDQAQTKYHAERAQWIDGHWWFFDVSIQELDTQGDPVRQFDRAGKPIGILRHETALEMVEFREKPQDFVNVTKNPEFLTSWELAKYIRMNEGASEGTVARIKVDLHRRLAMPWMSLIVTLIGIPFGTQTARKGALTGVMLTMSLFFGYYFLINMGLWMGKELMIPAWLAGWLPNLLFLGIGSVLIYRMR